MNIYLDNAASTPLSHSTKEFIIGLLDTYGNPSSSHSVGKMSKDIIVNARGIISKFVNSNEKDIFFTPSGSASNTLAIKGYYTRHDCYVLYSPIAHKSIIKCVRENKYSYPLKVDKYGIIDITYLEKQLKSRSSIPLVVIDYANSEIGTIQNADELIKLVHFYNGIIYLDCTGSINQIQLDVKKLDIDMAGFSAHKLGGLKGCGVLYKKDCIKLNPLIYGNQEQGLIGGTENILGIASLSKAVENYDYSFISPKNRDYILDYIRKNIENSYLVGSKNSRLPHNLFVCFKGIDGESLMLYLDMYGIQVSTGSACNSKNIVASPTLSTINMNKKDLHSCIRMTFNGRETKEELDYICKTLRNCVFALRKIG